MTRNIHLLFHVPEGLEFIAAEDIKETLAQNTLITDPKYSWEKKTGRVHLFCSVESLNVFREYIHNIELLSIYSVTLVASESVIPADIFDQLQPTYDFITNETTKADWHKVIDCGTTNTSDISFRATFKKEQIKHKAPSQEIAGYIGFAFSTLFKDWKVKMTGFTYEIMSLWFQTTDSIVLSRVANDNATKESVILLLGVTIPLKDQRQRNRVFVGRTSLNPCIAYCLARLADPKPGQIILDMCCGTGTIPIEGASHSKDVFWLGSEVKYKTLADKARGNVLHCKINNVDLMLGDGRKMCYRPGVIDSVVSDWPWGLRENSYTQIQGLYPKFMKEIWRALKPHGKAYIVTQGHKLMNRVVAYDWCQSMWHLDELIPIGIGGYEVYLYILTKNPNPTIIPSSVYNVK